MLGQVLRARPRAWLGAVLLVWSAWAQALTVQPYTQAVLQQMQASGQAVAVFFHAPWCPTCRKQAESLKTLASDADLQNMNVLVADYDTEKDLRRAMRVRSQSIMVVFQGDVEVTRVLGQTSPASIKSAFVQAL